jgi:hypothetical protein
MGRLRTANGFHFCTQPNITHQYPGALTEGQELPDCFRCCRAERAGQIDELPR